MRSITRGALYGTRKQYETLLQDDQPHGLGIERMILHKHNGFPTIHGMHVPYWVRSSFFQEPRQADMFASAGEKVLPLS